MLSNPIASALTRYDRLELRHLALTLILCLMLGGLFPTLVEKFGHAVDVGIWILLWVLIASFWVELPLARLLRPAAPLVGWLIFYICWGIMAAAYPIFTEGYRLAFRFCSIAAAAAVVTSSPGRLRMFANMVQWMLVVNLAVTLLLTVRPEYQGLSIFSSLNIDPESDRFAGMWGNANQAGLVSLLVLILSRWASRWQARLGQVSAVAIIYLTASRTASWILVTLVLLYLAFTATRRVQLNTLAMALVLAVGAFFALKATGTSLGALVADSPTITRVLDVNESGAVQDGGSRRQVLASWLHLVPAEPWYGYGLYTLFGGESSESVPRPGFPTVGPHNLYLGIFLDVGAVGLLSFLGMIFMQLNAIRHSPLLPGARRAIFAIFFLILVFANFNHDMLTDYVGWIAFSLMFLLPSSPALAGERFVVPTFDRS